VIYLLIVACDHNLDKFIEMGDSTTRGHVLQEDEFLEFCKTRSEEYSYQKRQLNKGADEEE